MRKIQKWRPLDIFLRRPIDSFFVITIPCYSLKYIQIAASQHGRQFKKKLVCWIGLNL